LLAIRLVSDQHNFVGIVIMLLFGATSRNGKIVRYVIRCI
jgi:hypothetical protein